MENILKVASDLGYLEIAKDTVVDITQIKSIPKNKLVIVATGSQGENMSALYRMAFSSHKQVDITAFDRVLISASAIPGNEKAIGRIINELYRKGAEVVYDRAEGLHVSGHACQEELKLIHALIQPRFFIPLHGEQRMLQVHARLARQMGVSPKHIVIGDLGQVIELSAKSCRLTGETVPAGRVFVDGAGVGDVGSVVLRDRKHLAQDGMIVVCLTLSGEDGSVLSGPDIITRGFVYVKENEDLLESLRDLASDALDVCLSRSIRDHVTIKAAIKNELSAYLVKYVRRNPMIIPIVTEI
jgi:ribonuclease J